MIRVLISLLLTVLLALSPCRADVVETICVRPGELVKIASAAPADWIVQPDEFARSVYIDTNKKTLVISSPTAGTAYIFAASADGEQPLAQCWRLTFDPTAPDVRPLPPVNPEPAPDPAPEPAPDLFPNNVTDAIGAVTSPSLSREKQAFSGVIRSTLEFIDAGSVTTPAGARETIRRNWLLQTAPINVSAPDAWKKPMELTLDALSVSDMATVRRRLSDLLNALEGGTK